MASHMRSSHHNEKSKPSNRYLRYSGLAIQMVVTIGLMAFIGYKIDAWLQFKFPLFLLLLTFISFGGLMYRLYKSLQKDNLDD